MKKILPFVVALSFNMMMSIDHSIAGSEGGGGGDAQEARVNEIRSDILKWIGAGGARGLKLLVPVEHYEEEMKKILRNKEVALSFTDEKVLVAGVEKTCRGEYVENKAQMLCNTKRFEETQTADQYRLIHHEYAGLVNLEKNEGAASDYEVSNQITDFLKEEKVLRLAISKSTQLREIRPCGLKGTLDERIKDCGDYRNSQIEEFFGFSLGLDVRQVRWTKVTETEEGVVILFNNLTQQFWATNVNNNPKNNAGQPQTYHGATLACKNFKKNYGSKIIGRNWKIPKMSQFKSSHDTLLRVVYDGKVNWDVQDFYVWTSSDANNAGLKWTIGAIRNFSFNNSVHPPAEENGHVLCVGDKDSLFE